MAAIRLNKSRLNTGSTISRSPNKILVREKQIENENKNKNTISPQRSVQRIDPSNPFGIVSTAIIFDKKMEEDIRKRVEKLHTKISKLKEQKNGLIDKNKELLHRVYQLETEQLYLSSNNDKDEVWMNNMRNLVGTRENSVVINDDNMAEQSVAVQKLMKGYVDAMQKLEVKFMELDENTTDDDSADGLKQRYKSFIKWIETHLPFSDDIHWALLNYGIGISAFFSFYRFVVLNSCIMFASYLYFLIKQLINFNYNTSSDKYSDLFDFGLPKFTMFSKFENTSESLANIYGTAIIMMMVTMTYSSFTKWIKENKKLVTTQLLSTQSDTNKFASLSFQCWNFSKYTLHEMHEQKYSISEEFRLLLQDEELANVKQNRSKKEKYILYLRRSAGIILNLLFVVASWYLIFIIISSQQFVITQLSKGIGDSFAKLIHPTGAIILVGLILPTVTFMITDFERWETEIQTMKNQIWRLYGGRIANLIVAAIPAYIIYKDLNETETISSTFSDPIDALTEKQENNTYNIFVDNKYLCFEDVAAFYLFKLVLSDFLVGKIIKIFIYYLKQFINTFTKYRLEHAPYNVAESIIEILYTQGLLWFTLPFYPFLAIFAPILLYLNFKFEKTIISKWKGKTDASWKAEETGSFFIIFYNLTLVVGLCANYYFLRTEWPCYAKISSDNSQNYIDTDLSIKQGPFSSTNPSKPWNAAEQWMNQNNLNYILNIFENALLFIGISIILTLRLALTDNVAQAKNELLQHKDKEIDELYKKLWAQKRRLELQMNENLRSALK